MAIRITQPLTKQQIIDALIQQQRALIQHLQQQRVADIISSYDHKLKQKSKKARQNR